MKALLISLFITLSVIANAQTGIVSGFYGKFYTAVILNGDTLKSTTQLTDADVIVATKDYVLSLVGGGGTSAGYDSLVFNSSNGYAVRWLAGDKVDSTYFDGRYVKISDLVDEIQAITGNGTTLSGYEIGLTKEATTIILPNESDPVFTADSASLIHFTDTITKIATKDDITIVDNKNVNYIDSILIKIVLPDSTGQIPIWNQDSGFFEPGFVATNINETYLQNYLDSVMIKIKTPIETGQMIIWNQDSNFFEPVDISYSSGFDETYLQNYFDSIMIKIKMPIDDGQILVWNKDSNFFEPSYYIHELVSKNYIDSILIQIKTPTVTGEIPMWNQDSGFFEPILLSSFDSQVLSTTTAPGNISISNGNTISINVNDADSSIANEGSLTVAAGAATTSVINSNTQGQTGVTIAVDGTNLAISESDNIITLSNQKPDQLVSIGSGGIASVTGTYPNFTVTATEAQDLSLSGNSLSLSGDATPVDLTPYEAQDLSLSGNSLSLSGDATPVDLTPYINPSLSSYQQKNDTTTYDGTKYDISLKQSKLTGTGLVKSTAGTISYDNNSYYYSGNSNLTSVNWSSNINNSLQYNLNGTNINTAGTLSNVAYLDKSNFFNPTVTLGFPATSGTTSNAIMRLSSSIFAAVLDIGTAGSGGSWLQATNSENLAIKYHIILNPSGGNVGIGTTTPSEKLDINGDIKGLTAKLTNLTDNFLPIHTSDAVGFQNSNVYQTSSKLRYNTTLTTFDNDNDIPNVGWVSSIATGNSPKLPVDAATTGNITLSGTQTIDGYAVSAGQRVLVKNQSTASQNGVYIVAAGAWSRSTDLDTWGELYKAYVAVLNGTVSSGSSYVCTVAVSGTLGTDAVTWILYNAPASILVNSPLSKSGNTISLNYDTNTLDVAGGNLKVKDNVYQPKGTYVTSETDPIYTASSWYTTTNNSTNWSTAYGWGNHATAGYLTSFTETDPIYTTSSWYSTTNNSTNWNTAYTDRNKWDGGATGLVAATGRTSLGATTLGSNFFTATNQSSIRFPRVNSDNTISWLTAAEMLTAIGAGTSSATVTSVGLSVPIGLIVSNSPITTAGTIAIGLQSGYSIPTNTALANAATAYGWGNHVGLYKSISYVPSWVEITGKPTIPAAQVNTDWFSTSGVSQILNKPTKLSDFTNDLVLGDITGVYAGNGMTGGGSTGDISLDVNLGTLANDITATTSDYVPWIDLVNGDKKMTISQLSTLLGTTQWTNSTYGIQYNNNIGLGVEPISSVGLYINKNINSGYASVFNNLSTSGNGINITVGSAANAYNIINAGSALGLAFKVRADGRVFLPKLTNASKPNILYYDSSTGEATYSAAPVSNGTVTDVIAGNGMTQTGSSTTATTLNIVSHSGSAGSIGTINVGADAIGVNLGTTSTTAYRGDYGNTAYTDRLKWDGGSTGLNASTARISLGFGNTPGGILGGTWTSPTLDDGAVTFQKLSVYKPVPPTNGDILTYNSLYGLSLANYTGNGDIVRNDSPTITKPSIGESNVSQTILSESVYSLGNKTSITYKELFQIPAQSGSLLDNIVISGLLGNYGDGSGKGYFTITINNRNTSGIDIKSTFSGGKLADGTTNQISDIVVYKNATTNKIHVYAKTQGYTLPWSINATGTFQIATSTGAAYPIYTNRTSSETTTTPSGTEIYSLANNTQSVTAITTGDTFYFNNGLMNSDCRLTLTTITTIYMSNFIPKQTGNITIVNTGSIKNVTFSGYSFKISPALNSSSGNIPIPVGTSVLSYYYDGVNMFINGTVNYN